MELRTTLPVAVEAARLSGVLSVRLMLAPLKDTVPVKALALFRVMSVAAISEVLPATVSTPDCPMEPPLVTTRLPEAFVAARMIEVEELMLRLVPL